MCAGSRVCFLEDNSSSQLCAGIMRRKVVLIVLAVSCVLAEALTYSLAQEIFN